MDWSEAKAVLRPPGGERDGARRAMSVAREPQGCMRGQRPLLNSAGNGTVIGLFFEAFEALYLFGIQVICNIE